MNERGLVRLRAALGWLAWDGRRWSREDATAITNACSASPTSAMPTTHSASPPNGVSRSVRIAPD